MGSPVSLSGGIGFRDGPAERERGEREREQRVKGWESWKEEETWEVFTWPVKGEKKGRREG
eukprot:scaffold23334_cov28-Tisochrysis_lutea.AAC.1